MTFVSTDPQPVKILDENGLEAIIADVPPAASTMNAKTCNTEQTKSLFKDSTFFLLLFIWIAHGIGGWGTFSVFPTVIYELGIWGTART